MNKLPFFSFKFSKDPIVFLNTDNQPSYSSYNPLNPTEPSENQKIIEKEKNFVNEETKNIINLDQITKDIQWISNFEQFNQILHKYHDCIIENVIDGHWLGGGSLNNIMVIGESPDQLNGQWDSFIGDEKILLKKMLKYINIDIQNVYITTLSYWKLKNYRNLTQEQLHILNLLMMKHIQLVQPKKILILGNTAAHGVLQSEKPLNSLRGHIIQVIEIPSVVSFNPAFLKRFPNFSTEAKKDMDLFNSI